MAGKKTRGLLSERGGVSEIPEEDDEDDIEYKVSVKKTKSKTLLQKKPSNF